MKYKKTVEKTMNYQLKKTLSIKIKRLDMFPNHFFGSAKINEGDYKINIQGQSMFRSNLSKSDLGNLEAN